MIDAIVVGSGASGANAAWPLVMAGLRVVMADFGARDEKYAPLIPDKPFIEIRRGDPGQHRYFLGDDFEGVPMGEVRVGAQLTPPRLHIQRDAERLLGLESDTFFPTESLALGGLAAGWGAGSFQMDARELGAMGLDAAEMDRHYQAVMERIGVTGDRDDLLPFFGDSPHLLPPYQLDPGSATLLEKYTRRRAGFNARGFFMGRTRLAMCTVGHHGRGPQTYHDMDFWSDSQRSVYRPAWTIEELKARPNFEYRSGLLASSFRECAEGGVELTVRRADAGGTETLRARTLLLAAGTMSTARIVLRSLNAFETRVPILCNPYTYIPLINLGRIGRPEEDARHSLAQLSAFLRPKNADEGVVQAQYYSYRSLLTFKLLKESPLPYREGRSVMRSLIPLFGILGVHHEDRATAAKYCLLRRPDGGEDRFEVRYEISHAEGASQAESLRQIVRNFIRLGCIPIKQLHPPPGSSIHYAGTFPVARKDRPLTCEPGGRLRGTRNVYLCDGSGFALLPAKGLTLTLMANADRIGTGVARELRGG